MAAGGDSSGTGRPASGNSEWMGAHAAPADAFTDAFRKNYAPLHRYVHRRLGSTAAGDVAAETFAIAYANWHRYEPSRPVRPWLFGIAANLIRRHYRDEERKLRAYARTGVDGISATSEDDVVVRLDAQGEHRRLAAALAALRLEEREVLLLHAWAELSDEEIASALTLPVGTVKSRLSRARTQLRNRMTPHGQPAGETTTATGVPDERQP